MLFPIYQITLLYPVTRKFLNFLHRKSFQKDFLVLKLFAINRKYPDKWLFIVSNRNLLPEYRKLGESADRRSAREKIKKMLGI